MKSQTMKSIRKIKFDQSMILKVLEHAEMLISLLGDIVIYQVAVIQLFYGTLFSDRSIMYLSKEFQKFHLSILDDCYPDWEHMMRLYFISTREIWLWNSWHMVVAVVLVVVNRELSKKSHSLENEWLLSVVAIM